MNLRSVFCNSPQLLVKLVCIPALIGAGWVSQARAEEPPAPGADHPSNQPSSLVAELAAQGAELYRAREYQGAIAVYERAFEIDADPNLVFNIARCFEKLGNVDAAIRRYEDYIELPGADTEGRLRAQTAINELRRLDAAALEPDPDALSRTGSRVGSGALGSPPVARREESVETKLQGPSRSAHTERSDGPSPLPWVVFGSGIVSVGAGALLYLSGRREHESLTDAENFGQPGAVYELTRAQAERRRELGDGRKMWGVIAAGAGGALLLTSLVWLVVTGHNSEEPNLALEVQPTIGGATFRFTGAL